MPHLKNKEPRPFKWRNSFNNAQHPTLGEISFLGTETRPDEVMSIRQIEQRYAGGKSLMDVIPRPIWEQIVEPEFDDYLPDLRNLDHADRLDLLEQTQIELDQIKEKANKIAAERKTKREAQQLEYDNIQAEKIAAIMAAKNASGGTTDA